MENNIIKAADLLLDLAPGTVNTDAVSALAMILDLRNEIGIDPSQVQPVEPIAQSRSDNPDREHAENFLALLKDYVVAFDWGATELLTELLQAIRAEGFTAGHAAALAEVREAERTPTERPAGPAFPEAPEAAVIVSMLADED